MVRGNLLSVVNSNLFLEHFEEILLDTADQKLMILSWFGHMDQQDCCNLFTTSTALDLTLKFTLEVKVNYALPSLEILVTKKGPKLTTKLCQKPTHTGVYLYFKSKHQHHVKRWVIHNLTNTSGVICQDQKNFNKEIKNMRHDLILNE
jgi:hypothetical protein